ncbi:unnamed protein product [Linum trigynum]|uniref:Uncharacterized protein n=1 Tax=Linum trigynum TaxID=586398 RepID=A0AAV2F3K5_9ROSI
MVTWRRVHGTLTSGWQRDTNVEIAGEAWLSGNGTTGVVESLNGVRNELRAEWMLTVRRFRVREDNRLLIMDSVAS